MRRRRGRQRATLGGEPKARPSGPTRRAGGATEAPAVAIDILPTPVPHHGVTQPISAAVSAELGAATAESPEALNRQEAPIAPPGQGLAMADLHRTSLGRYRIDRAIGRGSMGAVYLGHDPMLGRQVAIKTMALGREFDGAELQETKQRFFREAETAGRLQHRDIVTIYDVGEEQDLAYIAMEFLKGHDLQRHTQPSHLLPVPVVLRLAGRVAEALAYAHSQGVVHRDIKPANVMIHLPTGAVKVTDFGIARVTDATRTRTGMVLGTPSFMSPEHLAGLSVDGRSDLYSLGVMLFQLLTGQLPFQAESMAKLMYKIANEPAADIRSLRPELPAALGEVIGRLLQKNPATRPPDGQALAAELRAIEQALSPPAGEAPLESAPAPGTGACPRGCLCFDSAVCAEPDRAQLSPVIATWRDLNAGASRALKKMEFEFFSASDTGRSRSNNEDSVTVDAECCLVVLADGMGGYNAGEVASSMATSYIQTELSRWLAQAAGNASSNDVRRAMTLCVDSANRSIFNAARANPHQAGMGTTLVMGVFLGDSLLMGHVGDSRGYRLRDGEISQITRDHSLLQEQIDAGLISLEQAAFSSNKNLVTRAVGVEPNVQLELHRHQVQAGDIYLLCSDGLSDMLDDGRIANLLRSCESLEEAGAALVNAANEAGGRDNISVILARARAGAASRSWWPFKR